MMKTQKWRRQNATEYSPDIMSIGLAESLSFVVKSAERHVDTALAVNDEDVRLGVGLVVEPSSEGSLREVLRAATSSAHLRLHRHPGFYAVQNGSIGPAGYRALLARLYGFYRPYEIAAEIEPERSRWLTADLEKLGLGPRDMPLVPQSRAMPLLAGSARKLGAAYVVEGSTLGGRQLARGLDHLIASDSSVGRRFFEGRGSDTGTAWRALVTQIDSPSILSTCRADVIDAAVQTFDTFEIWMNGWDAPDHV